MRQIIADLISLGFIVVWIALGVWVYQLIAAFQQLGVQMQEAGAGFESTMSELGDTLGSVPLIVGSPSAHDAEYDRTSAGLGGPRLRMASGKQRDCGATSPIAIGRAGAPQFARRTLARGFAQSSEVRTR